MRAVILSYLYRDPASRGKLRALAGLGVTVAAAVPGGTADADPGIRIMAVPSTGHPDDPSAVRWNARALRAHLTDFRPDLLQVEEEPWHPVAPRAIAEAARLSIPVVLFSQGLDRPRGFLARRRETRCYRAAQAGIGGHAVAASLLQERMAGKPVIALPQRGVALPPAEERPIPETLTIGYVGRLLPDRGVDRLLRACATLLGRWSLVIAGTGPEQEALELLAERLGLASRVRWLGGIAPGELAQLWSTLDCLVLPAPADAPGAERWAAILPEAMARGVIPVVMAGGVAEAMAGPAGRVAADGDALAVTLQTLCAYPGDRPRLAAAARQRVLDHFVDAALARQTMAFWERVLGSPGTGPS